MTFLQMDDSPTEQQLSEGGYGALVTIGVIAVVQSII